MPRKPFVWKLKASEVALGARTLIMGVLNVTHGAEVINDPTGLTFDAQIAKTVAQHDAGLILNHMRGRPESWAKLPPMRDLINSIARDLEATAHRARGAGVDRARIVIDPGI